MASGSPFSFRSGQLTFLICVILSTGLWMTQQLSKEYERWDSYPVEFERSFIGKSYTFDVNDVRIRSDKTGWSIAFDPVRSGAPFKIKWSELVSINSNKTLITDLICSYYNIDPSSIDQIEGLEDIVALRDQKIDLLPVKLDFTNVSIPEGYVITKESSITPDTIAIIGPNDEVGRYHFWPIFLSETTENLTTETDLITVQLSSPSINIMISPRSLTVKPKLEQITEKRWDIPVEIGPELKDSFSVIPKYVQIIAQIPTGGFDNDSLAEVSAIIDRPDSLISEGIHSISIDPKPSCIQQYRLSPTFITLLKKQ